MKLEIKQLTDHKELEKCIELQKTIWGLDDLSVTSPITLKALSMTTPQVSLILGGYANNEMIAFIIAIPTLEPKTVYGHMVGVLDGYRDTGIGSLLFKDMCRRLKEKGFLYFVGTYEPLESRNAYVYLNKMGGYATHYQEECFQVDCEMHQGLPLDRFLTVVPVDLVGISKPIALEAALKNYPLATLNKMPSVPRVLVEIPRDLDLLKKTDMNQALEFRMNSRAIFTEYLNRRGYQVVQLITDPCESGKTSFYLLAKYGKNK